MSRFRDQRAAVLEAEAPKCAGCPQPLKWIDCPHGCGLCYLAADQQLTPEQFWRYGSWRMTVHTIGRQHGDGSRCPRPLFDGPVSFTIPTLDEGEETTTTEETDHGLGRKSD